jgi:hypothetical protein
MQALPHSLHRADRPRHLNLHGEYISPERQDFADKLGFRLWLTLLTSHCLRGGVSRSVRDVERRRRTVSSECHVVLVHKSEQKPNGTGPGLCRSFVL